MKTRRRLVELYFVRVSRRSDESEPVTHVSYFEADAYANWAGRTSCNRVRMGTLLRWIVRSEKFCRGRKISPHAHWPPQEAISIFTKCLATFGNDAQRLLALSRLSGGAGCTGRYNGKFMCNQYVFYAAVRAPPRAVIFAEVIAILPTGKTLAV